MTPLAAPPTSIAGLCNRTRRLLSPNLNDELVFTASDYTPGDSSLAVRALPRRLGQGSILSHRENTMYVVSVSTSSASIEVADGYDGVLGQPIPAGSALRLNPRFTDYAIFDQVSTVIGSLSAPGNGLCGTVSQEFVGMRTDDFYYVDPLISDKATRVLWVESLVDGSRDWVRATDYLAVMNTPNKYLRIFSDAQRHRVVFATRITAPSSFDDDAVTDCGMTTTMLDIPTLGAAAVLMQGQESRRVNQRAQGDPRRAEDTPITGAISSARELYRLYRDRIDEEFSRFISENPYAMKGM